MLKRNKQLQVVIVRLVLSVNPMLSVRHTCQNMELVKIPLSDHLCINPFMYDGISHRIQLEKFISVLRDMWVIFSILFKF